MNAHEAFPFLKEVLLFLALSGVLIPLLTRLRVNTVLGFLAVGTLIGPYGLATLVDRWPWIVWLTIPRTEEVDQLAELGVIFLMFMIGLEMSVERLWSMRRLVFGLGGLQVALSAVLIGAISWWFGNRTDVSVILGIVLAFSSTAIVMQLLVQRRQVGTRLGQAAFAVLLFQDLSVVPLLVLLGVLGTGSGAENFGWLLGSAALKGAATVAVIYLVGQRVVRPLFHQIAADRQPDTFTALTLLTTLGVGWLTWAAGLSMALGALLAGLIIAETEFRHEVEVTIEPFKGLLMGVFFLSVGMGIDLRALFAQPVLLPLSVIGLLLIKSVVIAGLLRLFGLSWGRSAEGGLLLGQGSEFAFIVIGLALGLGFVPREVGQFMLLVVGLSMLVAPVAARLGQQFGNALDRHLVPPQSLDDAEYENLEGHVIIAGYGRVGHLVGEILRAQGVRFVAVENDARLVAEHRGAGIPLVFGDASRPELLQKLHLERASSVLFTMDGTAATAHAVRGVARLEPSMRIIARARDERHALTLRAAGAAVVVPETLESSLQLAGSVLEGLGVAIEVVDRVIDHERDRRIVALRNE